MVKKEESKKTTKKTKTTKKVAKKESYFKGVKKELAKVKWPSFKEVAKYTIATIVFVLIVVVFFMLLNLLLSVVKGLFV